MSKSRIRMTDTLHHPHLLGQHNFMNRLHWNIALEMLVGTLHEIPRTEQLRKLGNVLFLPRPF
jgi:hypothetical protein